MLISFTELFTFMWLLYTAWKWPVFRILLASIFLHSDWIERDTLISLRIQSKYGKIGTKKLRIRTLHAVMLMFKSLFHPFLPDGNMKRFWKTCMDLFLSCFLLKIITWLNLIILCTKIFVTSSFFPTPKITKRFRLKVFSWSSFFFAKETSYEKSCGQIVSL